MDELLDSFDDSSEALTIPFSQIPESTKRVFDPSQSLPGSVTDRLIRAAAAKGRSFPTNEDVSAETVSMIMDIIGAVADTSTPVLSLPVSHLELTKIRVISLFNTLSPPRPVLFISLPTHPRTPLNFSLLSVFLGLLHETHRKD